MPDRIDNLKIISSGGLNSNENHLNLSDNDPGVATRLVNFEPSLFGGYRRISGYQSYKEDYAETLMTDDKVYDAMAGDIFGQGKVLALGKYKYLKWSYHSFLYGMSAAIIVFLIQSIFG